MQDKLELLYKALKDNPTVKGLPDDYSVFAEKLQDKDVATQFYDMLSSNPTIKGLPASADEFYNAISVKKKEVSEVSGESAEVSGTEPSPLATPDLTLETPPFVQAGEGVEPEKPKAKTFGDYVAAFGGTIDEGLARLVDDIDYIGNLTQDVIYQIAFGKEASNTISKMRKEGTLAPSLNPPRPTEAISKALRYAGRHKELPKETTAQKITSGILEGTASVIPDIIATFAVPEIKLPMIFEKAGLKTLSKFGTVIGTERAIESMQLAEDSTTMEKIATPVLSGLEGFATGLMFDAMGGMSAKVGEKVANRLIPIVRTTTEATDKALLQHGTTTLTNATFFGGYSSLEEYLQTGKISIETPAIGAGMGIALGLRESGKLLYAKGINSLIATQRDIINKLIESPESAEEIANKAKEKIDNVESGKSADKEADLVAAKIMANASILKATAEEVKDNPKEIIKSINESDLEPKLKELITDKVNDIAEDNRPNADKIKPIVEKIKGIEEELNIIKNNKSLTQTEKDIETEKLNIRLDKLREDLIEIKKEKVKEAIRPEEEVKTKEPTIEEKAEVEEPVQKPEEFKEREQVEIISPETQEAKAKVPPSIQETPPSKGEVPPEVIPPTGKGTLGEKTPLTKSEIKVTNKGVQYGKKTYQSVEDIQEDYDLFTDFKEYNKVLDQVRKYEDKSKNEAKNIANNISKKIGDVTQTSEEIIQKELSNKKSKTYIKFLPDIVTPILNVAYRPLVKYVRDPLANKIAGQLKKGVKTQNDAARWSTKFLIAMYNGLVRTQGDMFGTGKKGEIGKLEMNGTVRSYANYKATDLLRAAHDMVNGDQEAWQRVWRVYDPELATKPKETPLIEKDLNQAEKALLDNLRQWNTWTWATNMAEGITPKEAYDKYKGNFDKTGYCDYIARMYDKYEDAIFLTPEVQEFAKRGNNATKIKFITDYLKARKDLGGIIEINNKFYETLEELKEGLDNGDITREQYSEYKDQIKSEEWRQEHAIKDPAYLTFKRVAQTIQNVAIKQYMEAVMAQHPDYVLDIKKGQDIPKGYTRLSSSYAWGPFRNKVVIDHVVEDFIGYKFNNATINFLYDIVKKIDRSQVNQFYKKLRTVWNPFVQLGNATGNVFFATINGINPLKFVKEMAVNRNIRKTNPALFESLLKSGLIGDVAFSGEFNLQDLPIKDPNILKKILQKPVEWYVGADNLAKIAAYKIHRENGFSHAEAVRRAYDAFQNYSTVGKAWDLFSKIPVKGPTFGKFQADLQRIIANNLLTAPLSTIGTFMLLKALGMFLSDRSGESDEEREIRENRTGVPKIPIVDIPLAFKVGKTELNVARYFTPLFIYPQGDNETDFAELSKFMPLQFQKRETEGNIIPKLANADATWGWLGSLYDDRDFRNMSIQDPISRRYSPLDLLLDEKIANMVEFSMRSQVPFFKGITDIMDGATGRLDYYGRNRTWQQAILNNFIKVQKFDKPELKFYVENNIKYLTNRFTNIIETVGNNNGQVYNQVRKAQEKGLSPQAVLNVYKKESKATERRIRHSLNEAIPILDEIEQKINVYKKWYPEDNFLEDSYANIEAGKLRRLRVLSERDLIKNHFKEYKLLKDNGLVINPYEIPREINKIKLTEEHKKRYLEEYWSWYLRLLDQEIGLTVERFEEYNEIIVDKATGQTKLEKEASDARKDATAMADKVLKEIIKSTK